MNTYLRSQLQIIYQAHDRLRDIPDARWHPLTYYSQEFNQSNMFGHYVRTLDEFRDTEPGLITIRTYMHKAAPLSAAFNAILEVVAPACEYDIYGMIDGVDPRFAPLAPKQRATELFRRVEERYPRAQYQDPPPAKRKRVRPPRQYASRLPYKD